MKRRILALILLLLLLTGCGAQGSPSPEPPADAPLTAPTPKPSPRAAAEPTPVPHPDETFPYDYKETLADSEDLSLSVTALGVDREGNWIMHLRLENRTDEIMTFRLLWQSINGLAIDGELEYRVAVGGVLEPSFRILREELKAWGFEEPVQWSFTLKATSAESNREPYFFEELSASPFGEKNAVRYEFIPDPTDLVVMDNDYAAVYITGWNPGENGGLDIEYVAVNRCGKPLLLVLPAGTVLLDGTACSAELRDVFGAFATLMGYIPVPGWRGEEPPEHVALQLALADPTEWGEPLVEDLEDAEDVFLDEADDIFVDDTIPIS
ncbi:MAG: hypothetical protein ACSW8E_00620 [Clostridia bacterium]